MNILKQKGNINTALLVLLVIVVAGAVGYFIWAQKSPTTPTGQQPTVQQPAIQLSSVKDETANWKTYRNEKYGFEFKYLSNFKISEDETGRYILITPENKDEYQLAISGIRERGSLTIGQFVHDDSTYGTVENVQIRDESNAIVNGINVYRFSVLLGRENDWHLFFLKDNNHGVDASWTNFHVDYGNNPYGDKIEQILSTFKFTK